MNILIITQIYWPDTVSASQHLTDLAENLAHHGHSVTVYTSRTSYEDKSIIYSEKDTHKDVQIHRLKSTRFGKTYVVSRLMDFLTFNLIMIYRLFLLKKGEYDVIIGMTAPPLISFLGVFIAKLKHGKFCFWAMDLQPELAISAGYLKKNSLAAKSMTLLGDYIYKNAHLIFTLDKYMADHVIARGAASEKVSIVPVWPVMSKVYEGTRSQNPFRIKNNFEDKIVVMYSGNHALVHPLTTILDVALILKENSNFLFVFIGGGVRKKDVTNFTEKHSLKNIIQLPYQDRDQIHFSLGSSDIQVVIMGDKQVGFTHPNKIYGAMFVGKPIMYIGPEVSHITDILKVCHGNISVRHGEVEQLTNSLLNFTKAGLDTLDAIGKNNQAYVNKHIHQDILIDQMIMQIEKI